MLVILFDSYKNLLRLLISEKSESILWSIVAKMSVVAVLGDLKKYVASKSRADVSNTIFKLHR